ncbi:hypothetical protein [Timonella sp. A28]|uniref:hypothetical protein n=1 Tax=Timonella sp. A28 TaxID=3442640 RepID=UPI003EC00B0A
MASTIKHTIEISNNNHTPSKPSQTNRPNPSGATSQTYQTHTNQSNSVSVEKLKPTSN